MTCLALFSGPVTMLPWVSRSGLPSESVCGTPALRKYLLTMMSVASWDHWRGISASFISKTMLPSGLLIRLVRRTYSTEENGSWPALVNLRVTFMMRDPSLGRRALRERRFSNTKLRREKTSCVKVDRDLDYL